MLVARPLCLTRLPAVKASSSYLALLPVALLLPGQCLLCSKSLKKMQPRGPLLAGTSSCACMGPSSAKQALEQLPGQRDAVRGVGAGQAASCSFPRPPSGRRLHHGKGPGEALPQRLALLLAPMPSARLGAGGPPEPSSTSAEWVPQPGESPCPEWTALLRRRGKHQSSQSTGPPAQVHLPGRGNQHLVLQLPPSGEPARREV